MTILEEVSDHMAIIKKQASNLEIYAEMNQVLTPPRQLDILAYRRMLLELSAKAALAAEMIHTVSLCRTPINVVAAGKEADNDQ